MCLLVIKLSLSQLGKEGCWSKFAFVTLGQGIIQIPALHPILVALHENVNPVEIASAVPNVYPCLFVSDSDSFFEPDFHPERSTLNVKS